MDPILIIVGLALGLLPLRAPLRLVLVVTICLVRAAIFGYDSAGGAGDFILALIVAAANLGIGLAIGTAIGLLIEGRRPGGRAPR